LLLLRGEEESLGSQVTRVLVHHQVQIVLLDVFNYLKSVLFGAVLEHCLKDAAPIMLEEELLVVRSNQLQHLIYQHFLLGLAALLLLLLYVQCIIANAKLLY